MWVVQNESEHPIISTTHLNASETPNMSQNTSEPVVNFRIPQSHENISEHLKILKNVSEPSGTM